MKNISAVCELVKDRIRDDIEVVKDVPQDILDLMGVPKVPQEILDLLEAPNTLKTIERMKKTCYWNDEESFLCKEME